MTLHWKRFSHALASTVFFEFAFNDNTYTTKTMRFFGINCGPHDGGVACIDNDGALIFYSQTERINRIKIDGSVKDLNQTLIEAGMDPISGQDVVFATWPAHYKRFLAKQSWSGRTFQRIGSAFSRFDEKLQVNYLNHHLCHVAASWMYREREDIDAALYISLDGMGFRTDGAEGFYSVGEISASQFTELEYQLNKFQYSPHWRLERVAIPNTARPLVAGKLMGLAGYVPQEDIRYLPPVPRIAPLNARIGVKGFSNDVMIECASVYRSYIEDVRQHLSVVIGKYPRKSIVVGGGVFLALELNSWLVDQGKDLIFGPAINDSGIALGSAAYGYFLATNKWPRRIRTPFLQWCPQEDRDGFLSPGTAAQLLSKDEILAIVIGKGEAGPRALGHRSLLSIPSVKNAYRLSVEIKGREYYRPVAPIVTDREFKNLFTGASGRFMQFRNYCTPLAKQLAPGIVHNDNSARGGRFFGSRRSGQKKAENMDWRANSKNCRNERAAISPPLNADKPTCDVPAWQTI